MKSAGQQMEEIKSPYCYWRSATPERPGLFVHKWGRYRIACSYRFHVVGVDRFKDTILRQEWRVISDSPTREAIFTQQKAELGRDAAESLKRRQENNPLAGSSVGRAGGC